jgi:hypothetical protein
MELDPTIEFPYWIRLHTTAEDLISQIRTLSRNTTREWEKYKKRKDYIDGVQNFFGSTTTKPKPKPNFGDDIYFGIVRCVKIFCTKVSSFFGK